jgi:stage II sporulation protein AA (anti-sigma F factor antagonist)
MKTKRQRDTLVVYPQGELDHHSALELREELDALIRDEQIQKLVFDMRDLTFMDSSGIGVLIGRYRILSRRGGSVSVCNMSPQVDKLFTLSGLHRIIPKNCQGGEGK